MNFIAGQELGRSPHEANIFAAVSVVADGWKAIGPIFIVALWRVRRSIVATVASFVWVACFIVAASGALGLIAKNRSALTNTREIARLDLDAASRELKELELKQSRNVVQRSQKEIEAQIVRVLAKPIISGSQVRGTVGTLSADCGKADARTVTACAEIAVLREELAGANAAEERQAAVALLRDRIKQLRNASGADLDDPQSAVMSRLTRGVIAASEVGLALIMAMVVMIELVSAFAPLVLSEFGRVKSAEATVMTRIAQRPEVALSQIATTAPELQRRQVGEIFDYMAERIRPSPRSELACRGLHADYVRWCQMSKKVALSRTEFFNEFERICKADLNNTVRRSGIQYVGIVLADSVD